jgi:hypothetical protein
MMPMLHKAMKASAGFLKVRVNKIYLCRVKQGKNRNHDQGKDQFQCNANDM